MCRAPRPAARINRSKSLSHTDCGRIGSSFAFNKCDKKCGAQTANPANQRVFRQHPPTADSPQEKWCDAATRPRMRTHKYSGLNASCEDDLSPHGQLYYFGYVSLMIRARPSASTIANINGQPAY
jgi:hypothetical protein